MKQTLKYILSFVMENMKIAETKHSVIIALNGGVIALALGFQNVNIYAKYMSYAVIIFCALSIIISFFALHARSVAVKQKGRKYNDTNLLYYKNLADMTSEELIKNIIKFYDYPSDYKFDNFELDISSTIIANSKITNKKFELFNKSCFFCVLSIISIFIVFIFGRVNI